MALPKSTEQYIIDKLGKEFEINCIQDAYKLKKNLLDFRVATGGNYTPHFRGEQVFGWDITPGVFRTPKATSPEKAIALEKRAISEFETVVKREIGEDSLRKLFEHKKFGKDWDLLFQAQHAGVKTRLTDWSMVVEHSLFFATEESNDPSIDNSDAQLWCFMVENKQVLNLGHDFSEMTIYRKNPFNLDKIYLVNSPIYIERIEDRLFESRMYKQQGRFVAIPLKTDVPINKIAEIQPFLVRVCIPAKSKATIREELDELNIIRSELYVEENPDHKKMIEKINDIVYWD